MKSQHPGRILGLALAAASAAWLGGCEDSNKAVQKASADAAGLALSAGEPRASDALVDKVAGGATTAGPSDVVQNDADKDLTAAISKLTGALATPEISLETKSGLQAQTGAIQMQLAQYRLSNLQADILALGRKATEIQDLAHSARGVMDQADALEGYAKAHAPTSTESDAAQAEAAKKQQAYADCQAKVDDLQKQIAAKEAEAKTIYATTDAAFDAADGMKGQTAIAAADKAVQDRKRAEELMAQAGKLGPQLDQAKADASMAKIEAEESAARAKSAADAYAKAQELATEQAKSLADLRQAAANIIGSADKSDTLAGKIADFQKLAGTIDKKVRDAAAAADQADASYGSAGATYIGYVTEGKKKADDAGLDARDPYRTVLAEDRSPVLLAWSQAAAEQLAGRIYYNGAQASLLISQVNRLATDLKIDAGPAASLNGESFQTEAAKRFAKSAALASSKNALKSPTLSNLRWIGLALEATADQGAAATGDSAAKDKAVTAKGLATDANPGQADQLDFIK